MVEVEAQSLELFSFVKKKAVFIWLVFLLFVSPVAGLRPLRDKTGSWGDEVYDWINNRPERFRMSASDVAIQLDLIARVHGLSRAEGFFLNLTDDLKEKRTYWLNL